MCRTIPYCVSVQLTNVPASHLHHQVSPQLNLRVVVEVANEMRRIPHQLKPRTKPVDLQPVQHLIQ